MLFLSKKIIQEFLNDQGADLKVDGIIGDHTRRAIDDLLDYYDVVYQGWSRDRRQTAIQQLLLKEEGFNPGVIDGLVGPNTRYAIEQWQNHIRDVEVRTSSYNSWPSASNVRNFYGVPGTNLVRLKLPYKMVLAWDTSKVITGFSINRLCAESANRVLIKVLEHYGPKEIHRLGLDLFSGCYNNRRKRGGRSLSTHAYGAAIDFDSEHNQFRWNSSQARFARSEYDKWWQFWEEEGWISLGRERNYDWMHVQAVRL